MKYSINDLDQNLVDKINRLDKMELEYSKDNGNIVMYDGSKYYTSGIQFPVQTTEKVYFSNNSIIDFRDALYKSNDKYKSSFDNNFTGKNSLMSNFKNAYSEINSNFICMADSDVLLFKEFGNYYYAYVKSGKLIKISKSNTTIQNFYNVINSIKMNFVCPNLVSTDILDFIIIDNKVLVSTIENGVYLLDFDNSIYELKFNLNQVIRMINLPNGNILCVTDLDKNAIVTYDFETGNKVETSNVIKKRDYQVAKDAIIMDNGDYAVIGKNIGVTQSDHLLHYWKLDLSSAGYDNRDGIIAKNKASVFYEIKFFSSFDKYVLISGVYKNKLFIWIYDTDNLKNAPEEILFDKINVEYDDVLFVYAKDRNDILFNIKDRLVEIDNTGEVISNIKMNQFNSVSKMMFLDKKIIAIDGKEVIYYNLSSSSYYPEIKLNIYNENISCNNINIYVKSSNGSDRALFFNAKTNEQIIPAYYGITEYHESVINLSDCDATKIIMKISSPKDNIIYGVVVNSNRLFKK